jgi:flagellar biogenesis protein FliO
VPQLHTLALARRAIVQKGKASPTGLSHGAQHAAGQALTGAQSVSASSLLVQMVVGLVVIIVLIKLASKFVQGRGGRTVGPRARSQAVSVVGRQSLGKGVQVAMVAAGTQTFLLGVTQRQVTLLGEIDSATAATTTVDPEESTSSGLQLLRGATPALSVAGVVPSWKSALEQMRVRTVRRA